MEYVKLRTAEIKVLKYLILNGKDSLKKMSKKLKMQISTLEYLIKRLEEQKVILGYRYRFDCFKLGYSYVNWVFLKIDYKQTDYKKFVDSLLKYKGVVTSCVVLGDKDCAVKIVSKDATDFFDTISHIVKDNSEVIKSIDSHICSWTYKLHNKKLDGKNVKLGKNYGKIIEYILNNPKSKIKDISKGLKMHRNTVSKIFGELKKEKIIVKKSVILNQNYAHILEIDIKAIIMIKMQGGDTKKIADELCGMEEIHELSDIMTSNSFIAIVRTNSTEGLFDIIKKINYRLKNSKYIAGTHSYAILHSEVGSVFPIKKEN